MSSTLSDFKEMIAALSIAEDLANGNEPETALRAGLASAAVARAFGLSREHQDAALLTSLFRFLGCTAYAPEEAQAFGGDDVAFRRLFAGVDSQDRAESLKRTLSLPGTAARKTAAVIRAVTRGGAYFHEIAGAQCETAAYLASRLGASADTLVSLGQFFERFDGSGEPSQLKGVEIHPAARCAAAGYLIAILRKSPDLPGELKRRSGGQLDPDVAAASLSILPDLLQVLSRTSVWDETLSLLPVLVPGGLKSFAETLGDFSDMKSRYTSGHSRSAARLCRSALGIASLGPGERDVAEAAALCMNIGMVSVPAGILDKRSTLSRAERERIELHTIHTERVLSSAPTLSAVAALASRHHERSDGSGYHRGTRELSFTASVIAVSDIATALLSNRAFRPALSLEECAAWMREETARGRLESRAVAVVLEALGARPRRDRPSRDLFGLTEREVEVLTLAASGSSNKEIAARLGISARTVQHHTIHIYEKLGVKSRAAAAMRAVEAGILLRPGDSFVP